MKADFSRVLAGKALTNASAAGYSAIFDVGNYTTLLLSLDATIALTGGSTPGVKFTLEVDTNGEDNWVAASTLIATANGFLAAAVADVTITTTGKAYRQYPEISGYRGRVKYEITGTPTGGTASATVDVLLRRV